MLRKLPLVAALTLIVLLLVTSLPASAGRGNGNGGKPAVSGQKGHAKAPKGSQARGKGSESRGKQQAEVKTKSRSKNAKKAKYEGDAGQVGRGQGRKLAGSVDASSPAEEGSSTAPVKLRGRENAFNRILGKLWRMPDSALKGLFNALTNIGKWIGLSPPETVPLPPGETTTTPEPTSTPEPTDTVEPTTTMGT
ncbi:MAG: hypothetical protein C4521_11165 [Actinobacteria bacterium]|nr:MAG: hypothetical protein C4521_11165 [Actinomycetota bacterium]